MWIQAHFSFLMLLGRLSDAYKQLKVGNDNSEDGKEVHKLQKGLLANWIFLSNVS